MSHTKKEEKEDKEEREKREALEELKQRTFKESFPQDIMDYCSMFYYTTYKLQITNYKLQITNYKLQITNYKLFTNNLDYTLTIYNLNYRFN
jgi:hypothetical protein